MLVKNLIEKLESGDIPNLICLRGDDAYLRGEITQIFKSQQWQLHNYEIQTGGPKAKLLELSGGMSLFGGGSLLWLNSKKSPSSWNKEATKIWERLKEQCQAGGLAVILELPLDKRIKAPKGIQEYRCEIPSGQLPWWLNRMNAKQEASLAVEKLRYLASFDEPLLALSQWVNLWSLGGDTWAEAAIAWGISDRNRSDPRLVENAGNPAFAWVDAVVDGNTAVALDLLDQLKDSGADPFQLLGLLSKSARIRACLEGGLSVSGQPDFLVRKLRSRRGSGTKLLSRCTNTDAWLKSSKAEPWSLLSVMSL